VRRRTGSAAMDMSLRVTFGRQESPEHDGQFEDV
jgi:hypothetical protein